MQTKLKRKRTEHFDNDIVKDYRSKYSRVGSGRPVKRRIDETAQRDRHKQVDENWINIFILSFPLDDYDSTQRRDIK